MTSTTDNTTIKAVETFRRFDVDTQLALLWFGYLDLKDKLNPAPPASAQAPAEAVLHQIEALPHEQQLQAQRDILTGADTPITRAYASMNSSGRIDVWLRLAQGMESGTIIPMPSDYKLPAETDEFTAQIKQLEFEQRVDFMVKAVMQMGHSQTAGV